MWTNTVFANIFIALATNWTGHFFDGKELGYIVTNRTLVVSDPVNLHERIGVVSDERIELKALPSNILVWRPQTFATNITIPLFKGYYWTNVELQWSPWPNIFFPAGPTSSTSSAAKFLPNIIDDSKFITPENGRAGRFD